MSGSLLCLKWNNHGSAFDKLLSNLHLKEIYSDATLVCKENFYPVHQFVLSTCSEYFREIFQKSLLKNCKHPFIVMGNLPEGQIELLLNYMYRGEINVPQALLPSLLKAAEILKIKGLAIQDDDNKMETPQKKSFRKRDHESSSPVPKKSKTLGLDEEKKSFTSPENTRPSSTESIDAHKVLLASPPSLSLNENKEQRALNFTHSEVTDSIVKLEPFENSLYLDESSESLDPLHDLHDFNHTPAGESLLSKVEDEPDGCSNPSFSNSSNSDNHFDVGHTSTWNHSRPVNSEDLNGVEISPEKMNDTKLDPVKESDSSATMKEIFPEVNRTEEDNIISYIAGDSVQTGLSSSTSTDYDASILSQMSAVESHNPYNTPMSQEVYNCRICTFAADDKFLLKNHMKSSHPFPSYTCSTCFYKTNLKGNLKVHMLKHTGEKPFACPYCYYSSATKSVLDRHIRRHTGEKPFTCNLCSYKAVQKSSLDYHMANRHTKAPREQPLEESCPYCSYKTSTKIFLTSHLQSFHSDIIASSSNTNL